MEIYNETGKTKTGELRITRPIGALVIEMTQNFEALSNETITAFIERANGDNTNIFTDMPLKAFIGASIAGNAAVFEDDNFTQALCELCEEGSINLQETESIKIKFDGLKSAVTYSVHGLEYPVLGDSVARLSRKNLLEGETDRIFDVSKQELMLIEGVDNLIEINMQYPNHTVKYTPTELKAISRDVDNVKSVRVGTTPKVSYDLSGLISMPLVGVKSIDIKKQSGTGKAVTIYVKDNVGSY